MWWDWHDADSSRHYATMDEAEAACRAWVAGESDVGPDRRGEILAALSAHDHGDGCLGIIVDQALADDHAVSTADVLAIVVEAEAEAEASHD